MNRPEDSAHAAAGKRRVARHRTPQDFFAGRPLGLAAYERVLEAVAPDGPIDVRVSKSQVAFRRRQGFAYLWLPGLYLSRPDAEVVLSIALGRHVESPPLEAGRRADARTVDASPRDPGHLRCRPRSRRVAARGGQPGWVTFQPGVNGDVVEFRFSL